jgi:transcriptional regulator with XRE-family HTH domain
MREESDMSDETSRIIFSNNLKRLLELNEKQPADIVRDLGVPFSTVSNWINALKMPRMGKIELLANYLHCEKSDLIVDKGNKVPEAYYLNDEARDLAQFLFENPEYRVLFDASRKVRKEDLEIVKELLDRFS